MYAGGVCRTRIDQAPYFAKRMWVRIEDLAALTEPDLQKRTRQSYALVASNGRLLGSKARVPAQEGTPESSPEVNAEHCPYHQAKEFGSMFKVPDAGEDHRHAAFVGGFDDFFVAHGAARLNG
jgi:hypothetical protein